jgi:nuclear transport factor 2 (NTF2) superfamily protein
MSKNVAKLIILNKVNMWRNRAEFEQNRNMTVDTVLGVAFFS